MCWPERDRASAGGFNSGGPDYRRAVVLGTLLGRSRVPDGRQRHRDLDASQVGTDGVKKALQDLETAAKNLGAAAQQQFGPQVADLERAIASLRGTIAGLSDQDSLSTNLGKIAASVGAVEQAAKPIMDSVRSGCPSVPQAEMPPAS